MKHPIFLLSFLLSVAFLPAQDQPFEARYIDGEPALEVFQARPEKPVDAPPLLFIHGHRMGAWVFADTYLPFFYDRGYEVFALNLRGHGWSEGAEDIERTSLDEYYADLERAVAYVQAETGATPVLIGYSTGAALVQRYLAENQPPAAVLLGMADIQAGLAHYREWSRIYFPDEAEAAASPGDMDVFYRRPAYNRALLFHSEERPEGHKKYVTRMVTQAGSRRVWNDLAGFRTPPPAGDIPVLIVAGAEDPLTPSPALERARRLYNAEVVVLDNTRHGIPVGEQWKKGAKSILKFLRELAPERALMLMGGG